MWSIGVFLGVLSFLDSYALAASGDDYLLDGNFSPSNYKIHLILADNFTTSQVFSGLAEITVSANVDNAKVLRLHKAAEMQLEKMLIDNKSIELKTISYSNVTEILEIPMKDAVKAGKSFTVRIVYEGVLYEDNKGFYLSKVDQSEEIIATTQFQPTYARRAFPCFDEPRFKARFTVWVTAPNGYKVLSNQPGSEIRLITGLNQTIFEETPKMSPYLLALIVSKFHSKDVPFGLLPMKIWATESVISSTKFAADVSYQIIESLSNQLNNGNDNDITFDRMGWKQLDQVAIPDFAAGAMENWGLVTYTQSRLLWNSTESTLLSKEIILRMIAHEFTHSWFGNWVTTKWWNTTWLNEGFANYFEFHGLVGVSVAKDFELEKQFVISEMFPIMETDGDSSALPLTSQAFNNHDIQEKFGTITYSKGGSILRMLRYIDGKNFLKHLNAYIANHTENTVEPKDLFAVFDKVDNEKIETVMRNWVEKPGYPVVEVTLTNSNATQKVITLTQKQFYYNKPNGTKDTAWYIPIWYQLVNSTDKPQFVQFLKPGSNVTLTLLNNETVIINPQRMGYYRVNYNQRTWEEIIDQLKTNHTVIDDVTRAQLIDDAMNLARAGQLSYDVAFGLLDYLKFENQYHPWKAAILSFSFHRKRFVGDDLWTRVAGKINVLMSNLWNNCKGFHVDKDLTPMQLYTKVLALQWHCLLENGDCIKAAKDMFTGIRLGPIDANVRNVVYCSVLRHSDDKDGEKKNWEFLWKKYKESLVANEKEVILSALGCAKKKTLLRDYLDRSVNTSDIRKHDGINVLKAVLEGNPDAVDVVIEFLDTKFRDIPQAYMTKALTAVGDQLRTEELLNQFGDFVKTHRTDLKDDAKLADVVIATAHSNIDWAQSNKGKLDAYFNSGDDGIYRRITYGLGITFCTFVTIINHLY